MRDCPRAASPAAYTPGTLVAKSASRAIVPAPVERETELVDQPVLAVGPGETEGEQDEVGGEPAPGARQRAPLRVHLDQVQCPYATVRVPCEAERRRREQSCVRVRRGRRPQVARLLVRCRQPVDLRIRRPRLGALVARGRRLRIDVQLGHRRRALPHGRPQTVRSGVAAPDDHHVPSRPPTMARPPGPPRIPGRPAADTPSPGVCPPTPAPARPVPATRWPPWRSPPRRSAPAAPPPRCPARPRSTYGTSSPQPASAPAAGPGAASPS